MKHKIWEVWFAKVKFEDSDLVKNRPVLIIGQSKAIIISLKMTTHSQRDRYDYPLRHWNKAGLKKETIVRTTKICHLIESDLVWKIGRLSEHDIIQIQNLLIHPNS
ncbi:MAG: type II toxin-antitoxin system PemK/MazF family toxin [Lachnospiraceae bacterium]|nr:type II toxin-antitoxin system PemK/MazF family toxin [Lachnospiraceae bacterium]